MVDLGFLCTQSQHCLGTHGLQNHYQTSKHTSQVGWYRLHQRWGTRCTCYIRGLCSFSLSTHLSSIGDLSYIGHPLYLNISTTISATRLACLANGLAVSQIIRRSVMLVASMISSTLGISCTPIAKQSRVIIHGYTLNVFLPPKARSLIYQTRNSPI